MYTTKDALEYASENRIDEWVDAFLRNEGDNVPLADGLQLEKRYYTGPVHVPLRLFNRIAGPEADMEFRVTEESFEANVAKIQKRLKSGWDMPPFLIQYVDGRFILSDGNHRYEALKRSGYAVYSVIFWCSSPEEYKSLQQLLLDMDKVPV